MAKSLFSTGAIAAVAFLSACSKPTPTHVSAEPTRASAEPHESPKASRSQVSEAEFRARLQKKFEGEPRNTEWAEEKERLLRERSIPAVEYGAKVIDIRCATSMCRVQLDDSAVDRANRRHVDDIIKGDGAVSVAFRGNGQIRSDYVAFTAWKPDALDVGVDVRDDSIPPAN